MTENRENNKVLSQDQQASLLNSLRTRFKENPERHPEFVWADVQARLEGRSDKLWSLYEMERTGGEPDVVGYDDERDVFLFFDCAQESPDGRRSLCYDQEALESRKKNKPSGSAVGMAADMGIELLTERQYFKLQEMGAFDTATSSWLQTPPSVRDSGGAIFGDRRFGRVFVYHNGAESYYGARGFRGVLRV